MESGDPSLRGLQGSPIQVNDLCSPGVRKGASHVEGGGEVSSAKVLPQLHAVHTRHGGHRDDVQEPILQGVNDMNSVQFTDTYDKEQTVIRE